MTPEPHLVTGITLTASAITVTWLPTLDLVMRIGASAAALVAACFTIAVAVRALRRK